MNLISINQPCSENWSEMKPVEKGAFCGKCQKNVIDFSNKTSNEIKSLLHTHYGKPTCGRFERNQLKEINNEFANWENQSSKTFQSKFLYALLIVFGFTLFSCKTVEEKIEISSLISIDVNSLDSILTEKETSDTFFSDNNEFVSLDSLKNCDEPTFNFPQSAPIITFYPHGGLWILGAIAWGYPLNFPESENPLLQNTSLVLDYKLPENELEKILADKRITANLEKTSNSAISKLVITTEFSEQLRVFISGPNGKQQEIYNNTVSPGQLELEINLSDYTRGEYDVILEQRNICKKNTIYHQG